MGGARKKRKQLPGKKFRSGDAEAEVAIVRALNDESDRGAVLVATEWLSDLLEQLLRAKFDVEGADRKSVQDVLLNGVTAPLGTFAIRLKACHAFGLIRAEVFEVAESLREIRNHCAHAKGVVKLTDSDIQDNVCAVVDFIERRGSTGRDPRICLSALAGFLAGTFENTTYLLLHVGLPSSKPLREPPAPGSPNIL